MSVLSGRRLIRMRGSDGRVRVGVVDGAGVAVLPLADPIPLLSSGEVPEPIATLTAVDAETLTLPDAWRLLAPLVPPETWAAGVTYERSRDARIEESELDDVYGRVYEAERPELFLKDAAGRRTVGPGEAIAARSDAAWTVPEPELALVLGADGEQLGVTIGNDVSSRDIEGANPLYLPQAKVYARACAIGPAILVPEDRSSPFEIELRISTGDGEILYEGRTSTARMRRSFAELVDYLKLDNELAAGTVLLTGTGLVPPAEVSLEASQTVEIHVPGIGTLVNPVGLPQAPASPQVGEGVTDV